MRKVVMNMVKYIPGVYRSGRIELKHVPEGIVEARVIVGFLTDADGRAPSPDEMEVAVTEQAPAVPSRGVTVTVSPGISQRAIARKGKPHPFRPIDPFREMWLKALSEAEASEGQEDE
jgi:hypothetical protein